MSDIIVRVSFTLPASDPDDPCGLTEDDYTVLMDALIALGGDDIQFERDLSA